MLPSRFSDLVRRLLGIGTTVLADHLRKLEAAGVVARRIAPAAEGVVYAATERGHALNEALAALRRWGVTYLADPAADGGQQRVYDVRYVEGIDALEDAEFGLVVDDIARTLRYTGGRLLHLPGEAERPELVVYTSSEFVNRWATGDDNWDDGLAAGQVTLSGSSRAGPAGWPPRVSFLPTNPDAPMFSLPLPDLEPVHQRLRAAAGGTRRGRSMPPL